MLPTILATLTTSESTNRFGELTSYSGAFNGSPLYSNQVTLRDAAGRIVNRTESIQGTSHSYHYNYDRAGRLTELSIDGSVQSRYEYDANGNRSVQVQSGAALNGSYDAQDRLTSYGPYQYTYSAVGALSSKSHDTTGAVTAYDYDSLGNLRSVQLPDGRNIEYEVDANNRRIGKRVNGNRTYGLLYARSALSSRATCCGQHGRRDVRLRYASTCARLHAEGRSNLSVSGRPPR